MSFYLNAALYTFIQRIHRPDNASTYGHPLITGDILEWFLTHSKEEAYDYLEQVFLLDRKHLLIVLNRKYFESWGYFNLFKITRKYHGVIHQSLLINEQIRSELNLTADIHPWSPPLIIEHLNYIPDWIYDQAYTTAEGTTALHQFINCAKMCYRYELDPSVMRYYIADPDINMVMNKIGLSKKYILTKLIEYTTEAVGVVGFLREVLTVKYLSNQWGGFSAHTHTNHSLHDEKLFNWLDFTFKASSDDQCLGALLTYKTHWMLLYLNKYKQWCQGSTDVRQNGFVIRVHHHTVIAKYIEMLTKLIHLGDKVKIEEILPPSLQTHPRDVMSSYLQEEITLRAARLNQLVKNIHFPELHTSLLTLNPSRWQHLDNPIKLINEGDRMRHCIGGDGYIRNGSEDAVYFHYDDGSKHGLTIHLEHVECSNARNDSGEIHGVYCDDGSKYFGFAITEVRGYKNSTPTINAWESIHADLRNIKSEEVDIETLSTPSVYHQSTVTPSFTESRKIDETNPSIMIGYEDLRAKLIKLFNSKCDNANSLLPMLRQTVMYGILTYVELYQYYYRVLFNGVYALTPTLGYLSDTTSGDSVPEWWLNEWINERSMGDGRVRYDVNMMELRIPPINDVGARTLPTKRVVRGLVQRPLKLNGLFNLGEKVFCKYIGYHGSILKYSQPSLYELYHKFELGDNIDNQIKQFSLLMVN